MATQVLTFLFVYTPNPVVVPDKNGNYEYSIALF